MPPFARRRPELPREERLPEQRERRRWQPREQQLRLQARVLKRQRQRASNQLHQRQRASQESWELLRLQQPSWRGAGQPWLWPRQLPGMSPWRFLRPESVRIFRQEWASVRPSPSWIGADHSGPEIPPSLRTRQKCTAMSRVMTKGSASTCSVYQRISVPAPI
jgi:hypothetical protein